jgi:hypothetical protein
MKVTSEHIDYLQRSDRDPQAIPPVSRESEVAMDLRCLSRIRTIGVDSFKPLSDETRQTPSSDLPISLYGPRISVAYLVLGRGDSVEVYLGNWQRGAPASDSMDAIRVRQETIEAGLKSIYPASILEPLDRSSMQGLMADLSKLQRSGYVLGFPSVKPAPWDQKSYPLDRIIRSLRGSNWACLLLAEPVAESVIIEQRQAVIEELKDIPEVNRTREDPELLSQLLKARGSIKNLPDEPAPEKPNVLGAYYKELLSMNLQTLGTSLGVGAWRTALYLVGNESYPRLASVWRGVFSGDDALLEPVRVWRSDLSKFVANWAMSETAARPGPGRVHRLLEHQTILSSAQLAAYLHLPRVETNGFGVKQIANFGAAPQSLSTADGGVIIGKVLSRDNLARDFSTKKHYKQLPDTFYSVRSDSLNRHVFVAGVTGSGKTTTIFSLLKEALANGVNFLVVEPAKTEYRALLRHKEIGEKLQVFTLGDEQTSPLRINPFEVEAGTSIAKHIDLLRSLFTGSFGLWTPLPQILEECLYLIYQEKGWDITTSFNDRLEGMANDRDEFSAFPTLSDLLQKIDEVTSQLQWDPEAVSRIRGNLRDRLRSLRNGGRGRMLDVQRSLPMSVLLENPTLIELEGMGDDDDKAFMMGLLLIRLVEYRRSPEDRLKAQSRTSLRHLLVFEEAHRLLTNVALKGEQGAANPRAKAVETFANLLSEIRSYGQGVIIADQVPVKLSPDVIKNTNLKIAHRVVDLEDRKLIGGAMVMTDEQIEAVAKFLPGVAAVYSEGDDTPLLVQMNPGQQPAPSAPDDAEIHAHFLRSTILEPYRSIFERHAGCVDTGETGGASCEAARSLVETPLFQRDFTRLVFSLLEDPSALDRFWAPIALYVDSKVSNVVNKDITMGCLLSRAAEWYAFHTGSQLGWPYTLTRRLAQDLHNVLLASNDPAKTPAAVQSFKDTFFQLHKRRGLPYQGCSQICDQEPPLCLYRQAVKDIILKGTHTKDWIAANPANPGETTGPKFAWRICRGVAAELVEWQGIQRKPIERIGLCYGQTMLHEYGALLTPADRTRIFSQLIQERDDTASS